jgi:hypothetical protein
MSKKDEKEVVRLLRAPDFSEDKLYAWLRGPLRDPVKYLERVAGEMTAEWNWACDHLDLVGHHWTKCTLGIVCGGQPWPWKHEVTERLPDGTTRIHRFRGGKNGDSYCKWDKALVRTLRDCIYPEEVAAARERRRLRHRGYTRADVFAKTHGRCAKCRRLLDPTNWEEGHLVAAARNGTMAFMNIWPLCLECNDKMGTRLTLRSS